MRTRTQRCAAHSDVGQARSARKCTCNATQCEFAFPPTQPTDLSLLLQAEQQRPAFDEVRLLAMHVGLPSGASARTTIRRYWAKYSSYGRVRWSFSAQI